MSSSKKTAVLIILCILFSLSSAGAELLLLGRSGVIPFFVLYSGVAATTAVETTAVQTTMVSASSADFVTEETLVPAESSAASSESSETASASNAAPAETDPSSAGSKAASVYTEEIFYSASHSTGKGILLVLLFVSAATAIPYLMLFPKTARCRGIDAGLIFTLFPLLMILYLPRPDALVLYRGTVLSSFTYYFGRYLLFILLHSIFYVLLLFGLRTIISFLRSSSRRKESLLELALKKFSGRNSKPSLHITAAVVLMLVWIIAAAVSVLLLFLVRPYYIPAALILLVLSAGLFFSALSSMLLGIQEMTEVRDAAIEEAVRNERLRVDPIANVSHDLRTPLTSILGYGNLLREENLSESGAENLALLNQKSAYMKELVDSLFELTKVSSGVLVCEKKELDLIRLIEQTAGLFEDDLQSAGLSIKRHYCRDSLPVQTDGAFLNRVLANLLQNAVKYALPGTRIHLHVTEAGKAVRIRMTNVSASELDFDPEEITERFTRGDKARTTKGSGLGLAIAKTYTEALGGAFRIEIDGDVFAAVIEL